MAMNEYAQALRRKIEAFNREMITFVEGCPDAGWRRVCPAEDWSVAVTARHVAAGHFEAVGLAKAIVAGEPLPRLRMEEVVEMANRHAREHPEPSRREVLGLLEKNGAAVAEWVGGLSDADLHRKGHLELTGGEVSAGQLIELVILGSGGDHLAHMKEAAVG
jgi:hypothetical protein